MQKPGKLIGYCRVSTLEQSNFRQYEQLKAIGCDYIVEEKESGVKERPMLNDLLGRIGVGDCLVVCEFSRLSRSMKDLLEKLEYLAERQVYFISLKENIDTRQGGAFMNLVINIMGSVYQFERELSKERQKEGIAIAKKNKVYKGRKPKWHLDGPAAQHVFSLYDSGAYTNRQIMDRTSIPKSTFYRIIKEREEVLEKDPSNYPSYE